MVTSIVRQSVILKCKLQKSTLIGNYEYYYAAGLFSRLAGVALPPAPSPEELKDALSAALPSYSPTDPKELHLKKVLTDFHPAPEKDPDMEKLLADGMNETHLWDELAQG